jgi:hypothetical protein
VFTSAATQTLSQQYFFEYGYLLWTLDNSNAAID